MWAEIALSGAKSIVGFVQEQKQAESDRKWQAYNNTMVQIMDASNQNALTTNENLARERASVQRMAIKKSAYQTAAQSEVAAAASGTTGRSVDVTLYDVTRNENAALNAASKDLQVQFLGIDQQRRGSAMEAKLSTDFRGIPGPNPASYMLGFAVDASSIMNRDRDN